jgi:hypothetical protein
MPRNEKAIISGHLNGHVGRDLRGVEGHRILEIRIAQDMAKINIYFKKEENKLVTYCSGAYQDWLHSM